MSSMEIRSRAAIPLSAIAWGAVTAVIAGLAVLSVHGLIAAVLPACLAIAAVAARDRPFTGRLTDAGLELQQPNNELTPYESFQSLTYDGRPLTVEEIRRQRAPIVVVHAHGAFQIPARLNVPSVDIYRGLLARIPPMAAGQVGALLGDYVEQQWSKFGGEQVLVYGARQRPGYRIPPRKIHFPFLGAVLAGLVWVAGPALVADGIGWMVAGIVLIVISSLVWLARTMANTPGGVRVSKKSEAGLVITPDGLALSQGDMKGHMRWDEITEMKMSRGQTGFRLSAGPKGRGVLIRSPGVELVIVDIYDRPIQVIYQWLRRYWAGSTGSEPVLAF